MSSKCPRCEKTVYFAEKVQSMGKAWHKLCLKCERCNKLLNPAGHAEHEGRPYCHMPCYAALFSGSGFGSEHKARGGMHDTIPDTPVPTISSSHPANVVTDPEPKAEEKRAYREANIPEAPPMRGAYREASVPEAPPTRAYPQATIPEAPPLKNKGGFAEDSICPRCCKKVYSGAKVRSLGKDWHNHCLRCLRCFKKLEPENHEEHDGEAFCYVPCYAIAMGAKGVNLGGADLHSRGPSSDGHARHPPQVPETYDRHPRDGFDRNAPRAALDVYDPHDRHLRVPSDAHDRYHPRGPPDVQHPRWPTSDVQDRGRGSARGTGSEERIHHIHHHTHTHSHTHTHTKK